MDRMEGTSGAGVVIMSTQFVFDLTMNFGDSVSYRV